ncbi:MAG: hypothetical protein RR101_14145, partial [Burkholderiaceae bacterium]
MTQQAIAAQRQQLVQVSEFPDYFATKEGGEIEAEGNKVWDGGKLTPDVMAGPAETGNVTVSRPYRPGRDKPLLDRFGKLVGRSWHTVSVYDTDPDLGPVGKPTVYANALLVRL